MARQPKRDETAQTPEQAKHVSFVDECYEKGSNESERLNSYAQLAYYAGKQWIGMSRASKQLVPLVAEPGQVQYTANRIMPIVRTEQAKVLRNKLTQQVVPASTEESDIRAAKIAEDVVEWLEYELDCQDVDQETVLWALTTRIGFAVATWDAKAGKIVGKDEKGDIHEGQPRMDVCSIFEVFWDTSVATWKDIRFVGVERVRSIEYVKQVYGIDVPPEDGLMLTNVFDGKLSSLSGDGFSMDAHKVDNCTRVKMLWQAPCVEYPKGRLIVTASGRELAYVEDIGFGKDDDSEREVPVFPLIHIRIPGRIIGTCSTEQCMPIQREYNNSRSQIIENKNLMANPKWAVETGSLDGQEITREAGQVLNYRTGTAPPIMLQPASLGADVDKNIERCLEEFMYISGQQEVSHGSTPAGVTAGVAIQMLQEQDDTKLAPTIQQFARFKRKYLSYLLKMVKYMFTEERTVQLIGTNRRTDVLTFRGSDLTSTDVRFEDISATQLTKAAKQQYIIELVNAGVLNPQTDKDLILRMLELGVSDELYDAFEIDIQQALNENSRWAKGDMGTVTRDFFNHEVHVAQHNKFRKGDEYTMLDMDMQAIVDAHVQEHLEYIMQAMMPAQPGGASAAPGTASVADETGMDMDRVMQALTPEEQSFIAENPQFLQS